MYAEPVSIAGLINAELAFTFGFIGLQKRYGKYNRALSVPS